MNTKIPLALCVLAVAAPAWIVLRAAESLPTRPTSVLVLDNERTLEGDIERVGEQYRIRRTLGELWIQRENVLCLCKDRKEAYEFLRSRANLRDPDERLRLANWCHRQGLREQALNEVAAAVELRPHHAESRRLLRNLQRAASTPPAAATTRVQEEPDAGPTPPQVNTESLSLFVTKVQPILMNACANCHATGRGGAFKLTRTYDHGNRRITQQNLAAVLAQVNRGRPQLSPLLTKSLSVHGTPGEMAQPVLKSRDVPAYRSLEEWVRLTLETNPQLLEVASNNTTPLVAVEWKTAPETAVPEKTGTRPLEVSKATPPGPLPPPQTEVKETAKVAPAPPVTEPVDPYDPLIFNRQMHPGQKVEGSK
jgi:hypothetical protein